MPGLYVQNTVYHQEKPRQELNQGRNLEVGTESEVMEGAVYWLVLRGLLSLLSYTTQYHLLRDGTAQSRLDHPTSIINQENYAVFSTEVPSFQMSLVYIKLAKI